MKVYMRGPPKVIPHQVYYGLEGKGSVAVLCRVQSIPRPSSLLWSRDGNIIYPSELFEINRICIALILKLNDNQYDYSRILN